MWPPTDQWLYFGSLLKKININEEFFFVWRVRTSSHLTRYSLLQFLTELLVVTFFPHYLLMSQAWSGSSYNLSRKIKVVSQTWLIWEARKWFSYFRSLRKVIWSCGNWIVILSWKKVALLPLCCLKLLCSGDSISSQKVSTLVLCERTDQLFCTRHPHYRENITHSGHQMLLKGSKRMSLSGISRNEALSVYLTTFRGMIAVGTWFKLLE